jgi:hypothetical protein
VEVQNFYRLLASSDEKVHDGTDLTILQAVKRKFRADIIKSLDDLKESKSDVFKGYGKNHNWTHKSYLWELPYAKALILPHNINLMHQE